MPCRSLPDSSLILPPITQSPRGTAPGRPRVSPAATCPPVSPVADAVARQDSLRVADTLSAPPNPSGPTPCQPFPSPFIPRLTSPTASLRWIRAKALPAPFWLNAAAQVGPGPSHRQFGALKRPLLGLKRLGEGQTTATQIGNHTPQDCGVLRLQSGQPARHFHEYRSRHGLILTWALRPYNGWENTTVGALAYALPLRQGVAHAGGDGTHAAISFHARCGPQLDRLIRASAGRLRGADGCPLVMCGRGVVFPIPVQAIPKPGVDAVAGCVSLQPILPDCFVRSNASDGGRTPVRSW